jgi:hypothetical protein
MLYLVQASRVAARMNVGEPSMTATLGSCTAPSRELDAVTIISVRTSQETHYVSATKPNRLMLFRETVAVYCENRTEHIDTLCGQNAEILHIRIQFVPHRKHITSPLQSPTG